MIKLIKVNYNGETKHATIDVIEPIEAELVDSELDRKKIPDEPRTGTPSLNMAGSTTPDTAPAQL